MFHRPTLRVGPLVQVCDEFAPNLLVSSQSEGVRQQSRGVQVNCIWSTTAFLRHLRHLRTTGSCHATDEREGKMSHCQNNNSATSDHSCFFKVAKITVF